MLKIENLTVSISETGDIRLKNINLSVGAGELHVLMGPNGSGKSTLANTIMGSERYKVEDGKILLNGEEIQNLPPEERAKKGIFVAFQSPPEIPMVNYMRFLRTVLEAHGLEVDDKRILGILQQVGLTPDFMDRDVNKGFSGGEKKRAEMAQLLLLKPAFAVLDEPDSGVDIDSLKYIAGTINDILNRKSGVLLITHSAKILNQLPSNFTVHILVDGEIRAKGGPELINKIEKEGFGG